jgi:hypothetical protein
MEPETPFDGDEMELELPPAVSNALLHLKTLSLSPDHAFLVGYELLKNYRQHHEEELSDLIGGITSIDAAISQEERESQTACFLAWASDSERLLVALESLSDLAGAAVVSEDPAEEDDDGEG